MTTLSHGFTTKNLMETAAQVLRDGGYHWIQGEFRDWDTPTSRLFEDEYNIVGVVVFDTCVALLNSWHDLQESLVELISRYVGHKEYKAWDGYLVLLTLDSADSLAKIDAVRDDTTRLRKLVATGNDIRNDTDVGLMLNSLLPLLQEQPFSGLDSALDLLPSLLVDQAISKQTAEVLVDAFRKQLPLLEQLHKQRSEQ